MHTFNFLSNKKVLILLIVGFLLCGIGFLFLLDPAGKEVAKLPKDNAAEEVVESTIVHEEIENPEAIKESNVEQSVEDSEPVEISEPVLNEEYDLLYQGIDVFDGGTQDTYFKNGRYADLYQRKVKDGAGEYTELSLWSEEKLIWHTVKEESDEYCPAYWQQPSENLTKDASISYHVLESDGNVYLLRYETALANDVMTMSYKIFGITDLTYSTEGYEIPVESQSVSVYFLPEDTVLDMTYQKKKVKSFLESVESHIMQGQLVASTDAFLAPEPDEDAKYFIIEEYYSDSDASMMTLKRKEDGSFVGTLVIDNALYMDFTGEFEKEVLVATQADAYPDTNPYKLEVDFANGKAKIAVTDAPEEGFVKKGDSFLLERNTYINENLKIE